MNRSSTLVYIVMLAVFAGGMWMVLSYGSAHLTAPIDLAGDWELLPLPGTAGEQQRLRIDQSGKFFTLTLDGTPVMHMTLIEQQGEKIVRLSGDDGQITLIPAGRNWRFTSVGRIQGTWDAKLVTRTYAQ